MGNLLENKVFISTRPAGHSADIESLLTGESATLLLLPTIETKPLVLSELDVQKLSDIASFSWIVFTSPNGLKFFFDRLLELQNHYGLPEHLKIAVVGKKTASLLEYYGTTASFINHGNTAEDFVADFYNRVCKGERVLLPVGNLARNVIEDKISEIAECVRLVLYETVIPETIDQTVLDRIIADKYDMIVLTSPSGCKNLLQLLPATFDKSKLRFVCIGQITAAEVVRNGIEPLITAQTASSRGIYQAIVNYYLERYKPNFTRSSILFVVFKN